MTSAANATTTQAKEPMVGMVMGVYPEWISNHPGDIMEHKYKCHWEAGERRHWGKGRRIELVGHGGHIYEKGWQKREGGGGERRWGLLLLWEDLIR
jgi:hypothetical protein